MTSTEPRLDRTSLVVEAPATYAAERRYVLGVVLSDWLGFDIELTPATGSTTSITLRGDDGGRTITLPDVLFATEPDDWLTDRSMPSRPLARLRSSSLPVLYGAPLAGGSAWEESPDGITLGIDIFGSVFHLLAGIEEIARPAQDVHGRYPAGASLSVLEDFVERPVVDEYVDLLWAAMSVLWPGLRRRITRFRLRLTHDIDRPWASWGHSARSVARSAGGDVLRRRDPRLAARRISSWFEARSGRFDRDPYATYDFLMDTSERNGLRSVFYFMAGNNPGDIDFRYRLSDPPFVGILRRVHERGHEVGLHASYGSHGSAAECAPSSKHSEPRARPQVSNRRPGGSASTTSASPTRPPGGTTRKRASRTTRRSASANALASGLVRAASIPSSTPSSVALSSCGSAPLWQWMRPCWVTWGSTSTQQPRAIRHIAGACRVARPATPSSYTTTTPWRPPRLGHATRKLIDDLARSASDPPDRGPRP